MASSAPAGTLLAKGLNASSPDRLLVKLQITAVTVDQTALPLQTYFSLNSSNLLTLAKLPTGSVFNITVSAADNRTQCVQSTGTVSGPCITNLTVLCAPSLH